MRISVVKILLLGFCFCCGLVSNAMQAQDNCIAVTDSLVKISAQQSGETKVQTLLLAVDYFSGMNIDSCRKYINISLSEAVKTGRKEIEASVYRWFAVIENADGNWIKVIEDSSKGLSCLSGSNNYDLECELLIIMAQAYLSLGDFPRAMDCFYKVIDVSKHSRNASLLVKTLNFIGRHYFVNNHNSMASYIFYLSVNFARHTDDSFNKAQAYLFYAQALHKQKKYDQAVSAANIAAGIFENTKDFRGRIQAAQTLGLINNSILNNNTSLSDLETSVLLCRNAGLTMKESFSYSLIGHIYHQQNQIDKMILAQTKSLSLRKRAGFTVPIITGYINLGNAHFMASHYDSAHWYFSKGYQMAFENKYNIEQVRASQLLAELYQKQGNYDTALYYQSKFHDLRVEALVTNKARENLLIEVRYHTLGKVANYFKLKNENQRFLILMVFIFLLLFAVISLTFIILIQNKRSVKMRLLDVKQKLLVSQLNPQFIYQSLMSVEDGIKSGDSETAIKTLSEFARLVRAIFMSAKQDFVSLSSELEVMGHYMALLRSRMRNEFSNYLYVDNTHDPISVGVPPFLGHALVEALIVRGQELNYEYIMFDCHFAFIGDKLKQSFVINVPFYDEQANMSAKITSDKQKALEITQQRLKSLEKTGTKIHLTIEDFYPGTNENKACRIEFEIPLIFLQDLRS